MTALYYKRHFDEPRKEKNTMPGELVSIFLKLIRKEKYFDKLKFMKMEKD